MIKIQAMPQSTKVEFKKNFLNFKWCKNQIALKKNQKKPKPSLIKWWLLFFLISVLDLKDFNKFKAHTAEVPLNQKQGMLREK